MSMVLCVYLLRTARVLYNDHDIFMQYIFMFQWPKLPELVFRVGDYSALKDNFTADPAVSLLPLYSVHGYYYVGLKCNSGSKEQG